MLGIPYVMDRFTIEIPEGTFYIAEACAGLRFLIASIAFGVLYACLIYRSPWRRAAFMLASCIIPIIANGFRALGIVVLGHILGSAQAVAADHVIYGWVFFSVVILLLILAGLPFREDTVKPPAPAAGSRAALCPSALWLAAVLLMAVVAIGPAVAAAIDRGAATAPAVALPAFVPGPDCSSPARRPLPGPGEAAVCAPGAALHLRRLPVDRNDRRVFAARQPRLADRHAAQRRGG